MTDLSQLLEKVRTAEAGSRWGKVPDYPYAVSDAGEVFNLRFMRPLRPTRGSHGYFYVDLCRKGARRKFRVSRLVLAAFAGACPASHEAAHLDGDKSNNRLSNLQWKTHAENCADRIVHGTQPTGELHGSAKLTMDMTALLRRLYVPRSKDFGTRALAAKFGVSPSTVSRAIRGISWTSALISKEKADG